MNLILKLWKALFRCLFISLFYIWSDLIIIETFFVPTSKFDFLVLKIANGQESSGDTSESNFRCRNIWVYLSYFFFPHVLNHLCPLQNSENKGNIYSGRGNELEKKSICNVSKDSRNKSHWCFTFFEKLYVFHFKPIILKPIIKVEYVLIRKSISL